MCKLAARHEYKTESPIREHGHHPLMLLNCNANFVLNFLEILIQEMKIKSAKFNVDWCNTTSFDVIRSKAGRSTSIWNVIR